MGGRWNLAYGARCSNTIMMPFVLGSLVGLLLALTGAGGGILAVPLLVFALHLGMAEAAPIGLLAVGLAALQLAQAIALALWATAGPAVSVTYSLRRTTVGAPASIVSVAGSMLLRRWATV